MNEGWKPTDETFSTSAPICPYCGHEHSHDGGYFYSEDLTETECDSCGKTFDVFVYHSTSWTCSTVESSK